MPSPRRRSHSSTAQVASRSNITQVSRAGNAGGAIRIGRPSIRARQRPVHLSAGTLGAARLAMSIHRRLFPGATQILDELGDPWFRAGDAVRDRDRNRAALAGRLIGW